MHNKYTQKHTDRRPTSVMSLCARLIYTIDLVYGVKKACDCEQHWLLLWRYFDNKR